MATDDFIIKYVGNCKLSQFFSLEKEGKKDYKHILDLQILEEHDLIIERPNLRSVCQTDGRVTQTKVTPARFEAIEANGVQIEPLHTSQHLTSDLKENKIKCENEVAKTL